MNVWIAAVLFGVSFWFAQQGDFFFAFCFFVVLVVLALAQGRQSSGFPLKAASPDDWEHPWEKVGSGLAAVVALPARAGLRLGKWFFTGE